MAAAYRALYLVLVLCTLHTATAIYDDQFGVDDWHRRFVGQVDRAIFSEHTNQKTSSSSVLVLSKSNRILAALSTRDGSLIWRKIMHDALVDVLPASPGHVFLIGQNQFYTVHADSGALTAKSVHAELEGVTQVTRVGRSEIVVVYDNGAKTMSITNFLTAVASHKNVRTSTVDLPTPASQLSTHQSDDDETTTTLFLSKTAENGLSVYLNKEKSFDLPCQNAHLHENLVYYSCAGETAVVDAVTMQTTKILNIQGEPNNWESTKSGVFAYETEGDVLYKFEGQEPEVISKTASGPIAKIYSQNDDIYVFYTARRSVDGKMGCQVFETERFITREFRALHFSYSGYNNMPIVVAVDEFRSKGADFARMLTQNHRTMELDYNGIWQRDEALAYVDQALLLELPTSNSEALLPQGFWNRLESDLGGIIELFESLSRIGVRHLSAPQDQTFYEALVEFLQDDKLSRDVYGVHKLIFVTSKLSDTVYVLDSTEGHILHRMEIPDLRNAAKVLVYGTRKSTSDAAETSWFKASQDVSMIILDASKNLQSIYHISALEGTVESVDITTLSAHKVRNVLADILVYEDHSYKTLSALPKSVYFSEWESWNARGYMLKGGKMQMIWQWIPKDGETIISFNRQDIRAKTHAIGRALNDRSIQYKYLNPHLAVMVTESTADDGTLLLSIYAIDTITGSIIYTQAHSNAAQPVQAAIIDNWISYTYWDVKRRRFHIESLEFFRGKASTFQEMKNYVVDSFSSSASKTGTQSLNVVRQGYIVPFEPGALVPTRTKKGITQRAMLIPSKISGMLVAIPHKMLDARRTPRTFKAGPNGPVPEHADMSSVNDAIELPGSYYPELIINPDTLLTTNRTIAGISQIYVSPADLESTCVAFCTGGPDMFFTRAVSPSRHFDRLEAGFGRSHLLLACIGFALATYFLQQRSEWKQIQKAWA